MIVVVVVGVVVVGEPLSKFAVLWWIIGKFECSDMKIYEILNFEKKN